MQQDFLVKDLPRYEVDGIHYTAIHARQKNTFAVNRIRINNVKVHQVYDCSHNQLQGKRQWPVNCLLQLANLQVFGI
jgi:hypothetical protein